MEETSKGEKEEIIHDLMRKGEIEEEEGRKTYKIMCEEVEEEIWTKNAGYY